MSRGPYTDLAVSLVLVQCVYIATDLAVSLVLVQGVYIAYRRETYDATVITTIAASVLLFGAHAAHLLRA